MNVGRSMNPERKRRLNIAVEGEKYAVEKTEGRSKIALQRHLKLNTPYCAMTQRSVYTRYELNHHATLSRGGGLQRKHAFTTANRGQ